MAEPFRGESPHCPVSQGREVRDPLLSAASPSPPPPRRPRRTAGGRWVSSAWGRKGRPGGCDAVPQRLEGGRPPRPGAAPQGFVRDAAVSQSSAVRAALSVSPGAPGQTKGGPPVPPPQGGRRKDKAGPSPAPELSRCPSRAPAQPARTRATRGRTEWRVAPGGESFLQRRTLISRSFLGGPWGRCPAVTATGSRSSRRAAPAPARPAAEPQVSAPGALLRRGHAGDSRQEPAVLARAAARPGRWRGNGQRREV